MRVGPFCPTSTFKSTQLYVISKCFTENLLLSSLRMAASKTLIIRDIKQKLLLFLMTDLHLQVPAVCDLVVPQIQGAMPGEFTSDNSEREGYSFLSWHGSWYNHYAEKVN